MDLRGFSLNEAWRKQSVSGTKLLNDSLSSWAQRAADGAAVAAELRAEVPELDVLPAEDGGQSDGGRGRLLHRPQAAAVHA